MYDITKTAIVYLATNAKKDEINGNDTRSMLEKSLDLLYLNYNDKFKHDVIIFYANTNPFSLEDQDAIRKGRSEIKFRLLDRNIFFETKDGDSIVNPTMPFPLSYHNIIRWHNILIYKYLFDLGYEWYMRMDPFASLSSRVEYDMFHYMEEHGYEFGFRAYCSDTLKATKGLIEFCYDYCDKNNIKPTFLNRFTLYNNSRTSIEYNNLGYYNYFSINRLSFWLRDDVQSFLMHMDESLFQYTRGLNGLISQSIIVQIFMERNKIYHFNDWEYERVIFYNNNNIQPISYGGLYPKIENTQLVETDYTCNWKEKYGVYYRNAFQTLDIKKCLQKINVDLLYYRVPYGNNDFKPLNNDKLYYLGEYTNIEDVYSAINDHWLNCDTTLSRNTQFTYVKPLAFTWFHDDVHGAYYKRLYAINAEDIINFNIDKNSTSFIVSHDLFAIDVNNVVTFSNKSLNNDDCFDKINADLLYYRIPYNDDFRPMNDDNLYFLGNCDNIEEVYNVINDHWINCDTNINKIFQYNYEKPFAFTWFNDESHSIFYNRLYAINSQNIINFHVNPKSTSLIMTKDIIVPKNIANINLVNGMGDKLMDLIGFFIICRHLNYKPNINFVNDQWFAWGNNNYDIRLFDYNKDCITISNKKYSFYVNSPYPSASLSPYKVYLFIKRFLPDVSFDQISKDFILYSKEIIRPSDVVISNIPNGIENAYGIHLRKTDKLYRTHCDTRHENLLSEFDIIIKSLLEDVKNIITNENKPSFFIVSEDINWKTEITNHIIQIAHDIDKDIIIIEIDYSNKGDYSNYNSVLEMFSLSKCKEILQGVKYSTFSLLASLLGNRKIRNYSNYIENNERCFTHSWNSVIEINDAIVSNIETIVNSTDSVPDIITNICGVYIE